MRKFTFANTNATAPPPLLPPPPLSSLTPSPSPPPPPPPLPLNNKQGHGMFFFQAIPILDSNFDLATLCLVFCLILLSLLSLLFIFYLRLKSRKAHHLQNFNTLWSVRFLLVLFIAVWSLNEILRLLFIHRQYPYPFLPSLTLSQEAKLCKIHVVLSLGLFEPGFLITLLFLVNLSIKKRKNPNDMWVIALILVTCLPSFVLQTFFVFFSPLEAKIPHAFQTSYVHSKTLMCTYPLFGTFVFAAFVLAYSIGFLFSYWRVISLVINKGTRFRIHVLAFSVLVALPTQVVFLMLSYFWRPENPVFGGLMLGMFVCVSLVAAAGEGIMVIKPIADALAADRDCYRWNASVRLQEVVDDDSR